MDFDVLRKIYRLLYQQPTIRTVVSTDGSVVSHTIVSNLICGLEQGNSEGCYNFYIKKYHDIGNIRCIILDFDGVNAKSDVMEASTLLEFNKIMHVVVDSTNKGYHLYIILPEILNMMLFKDKNLNNKVFTNLVINLVGDYESLDKANYGLFSRIRQIGSVHPKSNKVVSVIYAYTPFMDFDTFRVKVDYYNSTNDYFNRALHNSVKFLSYIDEMNNIIKSRGCGFRINNNYIDLRDLFDGKSYDGGKSKWCKCPFHDDNKPSLHVYEKACFCEVCGEIKFDKIKKEFNL